MRRVVFTLAIACGGHPPVQPPPPGGGSAVPIAAADAAIDAAPLDRDPPRLAARAVEEMEAIATALDKHGTDCAGAAQDLDAITGRFADLLAANAAMMADGRRDQLKAAIALRQADLDAAATKVFAGPTLPACKDDAAFVRAFDHALGGSS